jgi:hypothetical protein
MKKTFVLFAAFLAIMLNGFSQKTQGPVLKPEIAGKYERKLKKDLAHGKGTATGTDTYTGNFFKGLPDGEGIYTYSSGDIYTGSFRAGKKEGKGSFIIHGGSKDSILNGYWDSDKYVGKDKLVPYEVSNKTGSVMERIFNTGEGNKVEINVLDPSSKHVAAQINATGQYIQKNYTGIDYFENVAFPIEFDIHYSCSNKLKTAIVNSSIRIKLNKSGNWIITLKN